MIAFDEALAIVAAHARPLDAGTVPIASAAGRVLAEPVVAQVDSPWADVSAMDGYAVRSQDLGVVERFRVVAVSYPGSACDIALGAGECVRIFTGAATPRQDCTVVIQENVERDGDEAVIDAAAVRKRHVRPRASDFAAGDVLLRAGRLLDFRAMVVAAGADLGEVAVRRRPRLALLGTGDELAAPGNARDRPGSIPESVSFGVAALAERHGAEIVARKRLRDDLDEMTAGAAKALEAADLVVVTGGASVGEKDFAKRVFTALGADLLFAKVRIMPGKPVWFARAGDTLVLGLPGNPSSAMVTARLFLAPLLAGMSGLDPLSALRWRTARLADPLDPSGERETFVRARQQEDGIVALHGQDSGLQLTLASADLLVRRPPHSPAAPAGTQVEVLDF